MKLIIEVQVGGMIKTRDDAFHLIAEGVNRYYREVPNFKLSQDVPQIEARDAQNNVVLMESGDICSRETVMRIRMDNGDVDTHVYSEDNPGSLHNFFADVKIDV